MTKKSRNEVVWDVDSPRITPPGTPPPPYGGAQQALDDSFTPISDEVDQNAEVSLFLSWINSETHKT